MSSGDGTGLDLGHKGVGLLVSEPRGGQRPEHHGPALGGLALVEADAGQLLAVGDRVVRRERAPGPLFGVVGAHVGSPWSVRVWARRVAQLGSRTGAVGGAAAAGVRMMLRLVRGAAR
ncbi:hypothetical protein [Streptomyces sp. NPDC054874]